MNYDRYFSCKYIIVLWGHVEWNILNTLLKVVHVPCSNKNSRSYFIIIQNNVSGKQADRLDTLELYSCWQNRLVNDTTGDTGNDLEGGED